MPRQQACQGAGRPVPHPHARAALHRADHLNGARGGGCSFDVMYCVGGQRSVKSWERQLQQHSAVGHQQLQALTIKICGNKDTPPSGLECALPCGGTRPPAVAGHHPPLRPRAAAALLRTWRLLPPAPPAASARGPRRQLSPPHLRSMRSKGGSPRGAALLALQGLASAGAQAQKHREVQMKQALGSTLKKTL